MKKITVLTVAVVMAGWTGVPEGPGADGPVYFVESTLEVPFDVSAPPGCGQCLFCSPSEDKVEVSEAEFNWMEEAACASGTFCSGNWPEECQPTQEDLLLNVVQMEEIWSTTVYGDGEQIAGLLDAYPRNVWLNLDRQSLQVQSCGEHPLANIPLSAEQVAELGALDLI